MRTKLSSLWVFVLLNIIIKDLHDLFRPGLLQEIQNGVVNGNTITEELMLIGGVLIELPILMILLTHFLPQKPNKWTNISIAIIAILSLFANPPMDMDDMFFLIVTIGGQLAIIILAWRWKENSKAINGKV